MGSVEVESLVVGACLEVAFSHRIKLKIFRWLDRVLRRLNARLSPHPVFRSSHGMRAATWKSTDNVAAWNEGMYEPIVLPPWLGSGGQVLQNDIELLTVAIVSLFSFTRICECLYS